MNSFLDILGQFVRIFVDMIPRFAARPASTDRLIVDAFLFGPQIALPRPVLYAPIFDTVEYWPITEESVNTEMQSLTTADDIEITTDTGFSYRIIDPLAVRQNLHDAYGVRAVMIVRGAVRDMVNGHTYRHIINSGVGSRLHQMVEEEVGYALEVYGMELTYFCIEDFTRTKSLRHFGVSLQNTNLSGGV